MMKKFFIAALIGLVLLSTAMAEDAIDPNSDLYVLNFGGIEIEGYPYTQKCLYPSPHYNCLAIPKDDGSFSYWPSTGHQVLNMIDTRRIPQGGEGTYASIPSYCLDAFTDALFGHAYRCVNLEDSAYYSADIAERIRAVMQNTFPYIRDLAAITQRANAWLASVDGADYVPVQNLTETECITATQSVLWHLANGITVYDAYRGTNTTRFDKEVCVFPDFLRQPRSSNTSDNCEAMVRYLSALPGVKATDPVMTDSSIVSTEALYTPRGGLFDAAISVSLNVNYGSDDSLTIYATCGDFSSGKIALAAGRTDYTLNLKDLPDTDTPVTVIVEGNQTVNEAVLFMPKDGHSASQTMGSLTSIATPVRATAVVNRSSIADPAPDPDVPTTGDAAPIELLALLMLFSCASAWMLLRRAHR